MAEGSLHHRALQPLPLYRAKAFPPLFNLLEQLYKRNRPLNTMSIYNFNDIPGWHQDNRENPLSYTHPRCLRLLFPTGNVRPFQFRDPTTGRVLYEVPPGVVCAMDGGAAGSTHWPWPSSPGGQPQRGDWQHARIGSGTTISLDMAPRRRHRYNPFYAEWGAPEPEGEIVHAQENLQKWLSRKSSRG